MASQSLCICVLRSCLADGVDCGATRSSRPSGDGRGDGVADVGSAMVGAGGMAGLIVSGVTRTSGRGGGTAVGGDADGDELRDAGTRGTARVVGSTDAALRRDMP